MAIVKRQPQYDPSVDQYPVAQQAIGAAMGLAGVAQNQQRLSLAERGQAAEIQQAQERLKLWQDEARMKQEELLRARELDAGLAQGADALLGGTPGLQGPQGPGGGGYESDLDIEGIRFAGSNIKSDKARALFFTQAAEDMKEKRVAQSTQRAMGDFASSIR